MGLTAMAANCDSNDGLHQMAAATMVGLQSSRVADAAVPPGSQLWWLVVLGRSPWER